MWVLHWHARSPDLSPKEIVKISILNASKPFKCCEEKWQHCKVTKKEEEISGFYTVCRV